MPHLPEEEMHSSSTQAEGVFETFRLRLAQRHIDAFFDFSQLPLREGMLLNPAMSRSSSAFEILPVSCVESSGSSSSAMPWSDRSRSGSRLRFETMPSSKRKSRPPYSITSSARESNEGGTVRPSALAVFMLITSSNLDGCSTGKSAGLVPLRILSTWPHARRNRSAKSGP
jgi:hypothetical protein